MKVQLTKDACKQLEQLPSVERKKIHKRLLGLEVLFLEGKKLKGEFEGLRSMRAWPYRII